VESVRARARRQDNLTSRHPPNSGAKDEVSIRNSCRASTETKLLVPPRALKACAHLSQIAPDSALARRRSSLKHIHREIVRISPLPGNAELTGEPGPLGAITTPGVSCQQFVESLPSIVGEFNTLLQLTPGVVIAPSGLVHPVSSALPGRGLMRTISRWMVFQ